MPERAGECHWTAEDFTIIHWRQPAATTHVNSTIVTMNLLLRLHLYVLQEHHMIGIIPISVDGPDSKSPVMITATEAGTIRPCCPSSQRSPNLFLAKRWSCSRLTNSHIRSKRSLLEVRIKRFPFKRNPRVGGIAIHLVP